MRENYISKDFLGTINGIKIKRYETYNITKKILEEIEKKFNETKFTKKFINDLITNADMRIITEEKYGAYNIQKDMLESVNKADKFNDISFKNMEKLNENISMEIYNSKRNITITSEEITPFAAKIGTTEINNHNIYILTNNLIDKIDKKFTDNSYNEKFIPTLVENLENIKKTTPDLNFYDLKETLSKQIENSNSFKEIQFNYNDKTIINAENYATQFEKEIKQEEKKEEKFKPKNHREEFIKDVIKSLENGKVPWEKSWENAPLNATTNQKYQGCNSIRLSMAADAQGFKDPRWVTFKQAKDNNWKVKKGSKSTTIEVFKFYDKGTKKDLDMDFIQTLSEKEKREYLKSNVQMIIKNYNVFNAEQIEGIPPYVKEEKKVDYDKIRLIEQNCGVPINFGGNQAYYNPNRDTITMPPRESFKSENGYYATMLHEIAHSTGHPSRLNRNLNNKFGTPEYAKEELVAELTSVFIGQEKGLKYNYENNKAYIQSWIKALKNDPNELFKAAAKAQRATTMVLNYEKGINNSKELTKEKSKGIEISR